MNNRTKASMQDYVGASLRATNRTSKERNNESRTVANAIQAQLTKGKHYCAEAADKEVRHDEKTQSSLQKFAFQCLAKTNYKAAQAKTKTMGGNTRQKAGAVIASRNGISTANPPKILGHTERTNGMLRATASFGGDRERLTKAEIERRVKSIEDNIIGSSKNSVPNIGRAANEN